MLKLYVYNELKNNEIEKICNRGSVLNKKTFDIVEEIENNVKKNGDKAIKELSLKFDKVNLKNIKVTDKEFEESEKISTDLKKAIKVAYKNINKFHKSQLKQLNIFNKIETTKGVYCWRKFTPIENVGLYIPGGTAPLFSTVLMLGIPAIIAKCKNIILCSPPNIKGKIANEILWTAKLLGINQIYKVGGAQAIFAMTYGTETIKKVDKIFGPGNSFVMTAKIKAQNYVAIDMPAGPSEVLIIADKESNPKFVASDMLSQAEHGIDSQVVLVSSNKNIINKTLTEINEQLKVLPRKDIAKKALENSFVVLTKNTEESIEFSNIYAPEHLILSINDYQKYLELIKNAGSVFCGKYSSESFGDYASGTNHTLPTSGYAKNYSGISIESFGKFISFQEISKNGFSNLSKYVEIMAENEKLIAHKNAVAIRRKFI